MSDNPHPRLATAGRSGPADDRRRIETEAATRAIAGVERLAPGLTDGRPPAGHCF